MPRTHSLASCYENSLTIILRLPLLERQSTANSQDLRTSIRAALRAAVEQAKALGYSSELNQLAFFAVVALLDESVLKLANPAFADWAQRPLQEELFGHNRAGEIFFDHLQSLLARQDSGETADCLEVYCLCMQLGLRGKYALRSAIGYGQGANGDRARPSGEIRTLVGQCREKINRIRRHQGFLPDRTLPEVSQAVQVDRLSRTLGIVAAVLFAVLLLTFAGARITLGSGASQLGSLVESAGR